MKDSPIFLSKSLFRLSISVGMIILASALISCNHYSAKMQKTFQIAGENAQELKKVLTHYRQKDPNKLKYKAAQFLIENMAYHIIHCKDQASTDIIKHWIQLFKIQHRIILN